MNVGLRNTCYRKENSILDGIPTPPVVSSVFVGELGWSLEDSGLFRSE